LCLFCSDNLQFKNIKACLKSTKTRATKYT
jgi:hypothetical protein